MQQLAGLDLQAVCLKSAARNRAEYLRRPDLGRRLSPGSRTALEQVGEPTQGQDRAWNGAPRLIIVIADGLSAIAPERHALPLLDALLPMLEGWKIGPVVVAEQARVAIGDEIGELMRAELMLLLIGERPGLSSPDSLGVYITWAPRVGRSDAERNCISNIRPEGLSYGLAARKIAGYLTEARRRQLTGVALKEDLPQIKA
jgi:ethanolamine ammonia-lyase small subunit